MKWYQLGALVNGFLLGSQVLALVPPAWVKHSPVYLNLSSGTESFDEAPVIGRPAVWTTNHRSPSNIDLSMPVFVSVSVCDLKRQPGDVNAVGSVISSEQGIVEKPQPFSFNTATQQTSTMITYQRLDSDEIPAGLSAEEKNKLIATLQGNVHSQADYNTLDAKAWHAGDIESYPVDSAINLHHMLHEMYPEKIPQSLQRIIESQPMSALNALHLKTKNEVG